MPHASDRSREPGRHRRRVPRPRRGGGAPWVLGRCPPGTGRSWSTTGRPTARRQSPRRTARTVVHEPRRGFGAACCGRAPGRDQRGGVLLRRRRLASTPATCPRWPGPSSPGARPTSVLRRPARRRPGPGRPTPAPPTGLLAWELRRRAGLAAHRPRAAAGRPPRGDFSISGSPTAASDGRWRWSSAPPPATGGSRSTPSPTDRGVGTVEGDGHCPGHRRAPYATCTRSSATSPRPARPERNAGGNAPRPGVRVLGDDPCRAGGARPATCSDRTPGPTPPAARPTPDPVPTPAAPGPGPRPPGRRARHRAHAGRRPTERPVRRRPRPAGRPPERHIRQAPRGPVGRGRAGRGRGGRRCSSWGRRRPWRRRACARSPPSGGRSSGWRRALAAACTTWRPPRAFVLVGGAFLAWMALSTATALDPLTALVGHPAGTSAWPPGSWRGSPSSPAPASAART